MVASGLHPELIRDPARVQEVCTRAAAVGMVAVDTESDSLHSYFHKLCLIQVSFAGNHFVLDPLAEISPEARHPALGVSIAECRAMLAAKSKRETGVRLIEGPAWVSPTSS